MTKNHTFNRLEQLVSTDRGKTILKIGEGTVSMLLGTYLLGESMDHLHRSEYALYFASGAMSFIVGGVLLTDTAVEYFRQKFK